MPSEYVLNCYISMKYLSSFLNNLRNYCASCWVGAKQSRTYKCGNIPLCVFIIHSLNIKWTFIHLTWFTGCLSCAREWEKFRDNSGRKSTMMFAGPECDFCPRFRNAWIPPTNLPSFRGKSKQCIINGSISVSETCLMIQLKLRWNVWACT